MDNYVPPSKLISDAARAEELCTMEELEEASEKYRKAQENSRGCDQPMVRYLTDDRDYSHRRELCILMGGNGDWYVGVASEGEHPRGMVRICTSGGASQACPGLTSAIAAAYRAISNAQRSKQ